MKGYGLFAIMVIAFAVVFASAPQHVVAPRAKLSPAVTVVPSPSSADPAPILATPALGVSETILRRNANGHFYTQASVNGQPVDFLVDTGATTVALTIDDARRLGIPVDPQGFAVIGSGASGPVRGAQISLGEVDLDGKRANNIQGVVIEGLGVSLLGQSFLRTIGTVEITGDAMTLR